MRRTFSYVAIPSTDFERAFAFYSAVTGGRVQRNEQTPFPMAYFTDQDGAYVGHLFQLETIKTPAGGAVALKPSADGPIVYMELEKDLNVALARVANAGGGVVMGKTLIGPGKGFWAMFLDTEGNRLALHSET